MERGTCKGCKHLDHWVKAVKAEKHYITVFGHRICIFNEENRRFHLPFGEWNFFDCMLNPGGENLGTDICDEGEEVSYPIRCSYYAED